MSDAWLWFSGLDAWLQWLIIVAAWLALWWLVYTAWQLARIAGNVADIAERRKREE